MATATVFSAEPKRYAMKLESLQKARQLLPDTRYTDPELGRDLEHLIKKTQSDLQRYSDAMKVSRPHTIARQSLIVETDFPEYFFGDGTKASCTYYQEKYRSFIQMSCNVKVWFDAAIVSLLVQGAPDLAEYGLQDGMGLMTRSYASDKVESYVQNLSQPWQEGLSFNFINLHLALNPGIDHAIIPSGTPIFSVFPVLNRQCYRYIDRRTMD